jgi:hypothetical protein
VDIVIDAPTQAANPSHTGGGFQSTVPQSPSPIAAFSLNQAHCLHRYYITTTNHDDFHRIREFGIFYKSLKILSRDERRVGRRFFVTFFFVLSGYVFLDFWRFFAVSWTPLGWGGLFYLRCVAGFGEGEWSVFCDGFDTQL